MRRVFVMALALLLPACEVQTGTAEAERTVARVSPAGPISIIYRDDESNERILNGSCFDGYFSGNGQYERKTGDPNNSFIAHGQTSRGLPIVLVIGRPVGRPVTMAPI